MQIKRKGNSFPPFHIIMRSLLVLDFMLARAANVWVDDDLSLLQTRAVLQNGDLVSQPGLYVITDPPGPFGSATCNRNLIFSDSLDNVIREDPSQRNPIGPAAWLSLPGDNVALAKAATNAEDCGAACTEYPGCMFWQWDSVGAHDRGISGFFGPTGNSNSAKCIFRSNTGPNGAIATVNPDGNVWVNDPCNIYACTTPNNAACGQRACRFPPTERFCEEVDMEYYREDGYALHYLQPLPSAAERGRSDAPPDEFQHLDHLCGHHLDPRRRRGLGLRPQVR